MNGVCACACVSACVRLLNCAVLAVLHVHAMCMDTMWSEAGLFAPDRQFAAAGICFHCAHHTLLRPCCHSQLVEKHLEGKERV